MYIYIYICYIPWAGVFHAFRHEAEAKAGKATKATPATPKASPKGDPEKVKLEAAIKAKAEKLGYKDRVLRPPWWYLSVTAKKYIDVDIDMGIDIRPGIE